MKRVFGFVTALLVIINVSTAQNNGFSSKLFDNYSKFKEKEITNRRLKHEDIVSLLDILKSENKLHIQKVGESIEGRSLNLISLGDGETDVFLWSQMHGDESTATMAIFDMLNFFNSEEFEDERKIILKKLRIHFLPMLNPDGAEKFMRRNALGVDVNRDALRLQSPEAKTLKRIRDSLDADFGFNLHDQSKYYNAEQTEKPATISFLAPAYNYEKEINVVRGDAMKVIVQMNKVLQKFVPGQVGRYNDDFEPRAFGDNIQKWGTSTILIESGGFPEDPEKQEIRKLNFVSILSALNSIATESYRTEDISEYERIPNNDRMLFDLKITGLKYHLNEKDYILDIGINKDENDIEGAADFYYSGRVVDLGDLSTSYGYEELDASGLKLVFGKVYPEKISSPKELEVLNAKELLEKGYAYIKVDSSMLKVPYSNFPINLVPEDYKINTHLAPGKNANFFLYKNGEMEYAIINGFLLDTKVSLDKIINTLIFK
ncbi:M14 family metallopeptidase [Christiangramia forsetii]|uniref:Secreted peptidase, family M14 n=2 Tax=Christiangramia forsetii TaxID=411153 RepID=A0M512_CHRFK|nr:M14 metallopeptidase family protein [Christiangramia forsetii]GGG22114.1 hypothetical protein GCM10011532_01470 [Christiangramia forsetii]CAL67707.1 secreted peptidase, family M14 [Christiangramia forsetii KT0803]